MATRTHYQAQTTAGRAKHAASIIKAYDGCSISRELDHDFESGDGDTVWWLLCDMARTDTVLCWALRNRWGAEYVDKAMVRHVQPVLFES